MHGRRRRQNVCCLAHELRGLDFGSGGDDLGFSGSLGLRGHGERVLQILVEDQVLDEHGLDFYTPTSSGLFDDFADGLRDLLAALDDILQNAGTDYVAKCCLCALDECLAYIGNAEGSLVRRSDSVVDDRGELQRYVVFGHADLLGNLDNLDLDIDLNELLRKRVDVNETGVDSAGESTELSDQSDVSLIYRLVRVGAANAAWDGSESTHNATKSVDLGGVRFIRE